MAELRDVHGVAVLAYPPGQPVPTDPVDVIGDVFAHEADLVVLPAERLPEEFFVLRSGVAGEWAQKFVNYRVRLAVVGDVSRQVAASDAFRDFVRETNRGDQLWFLPSLADLEARLTPAR